MREVVEAEQLPVGGWAVSADGQYVRHSNAPAAVFSVDMTGLLEPLQPPAAAPQPGTVWRDACVIDQVKPKRQWTQEEKEEVARAPPSRRAEVAPKQQFLLAAWDEMIIYPPSHSHGATPFNAFTVKACREHMTLLRAAAAGIQGSEWVC